MITNFLSHQLLSKFISFSNFSITKESIDISCFLCFARYRDPKNGTYTLFLKLSTKGEEEETRLVTWRIKMQEKTCIWIIIPIWHCLFLLFSERRLAGCASSLVLPLCLFLVASYFYFRICSFYIFFSKLETHLSTTSSCRLPPVYFLSSPQSPQYILYHKKTRTKCYWSVFLQPICYNHFPLYWITESTVHHLQEQRHFVSTIFNRFLVLLSFQLLFCNSPAIFLTPQCLVWQ